MKDGYLDFDEYLYYPVEIIREQKTLLRYE